MTTEQSWSVSSKPKELEEHDELARLAGRWNIGIEVHITNPYTYSQGPIKQVPLERAQYRA